MPKFERPEVNGQMQFIRTGQNIFVPERNQQIDHRELAEEFDITDFIKVLKKIAPDQVDAGFVEIRMDIYTTVIDGQSEELELPITCKAREITIVTFQKYNPGHRVQ